MIELYNRDYYEKINKLRKIFLYILISFIVLCLGVVVFGIVFYANEPYGTSLETPLKTMVLGTSVLCTIVSFAFYGLVLGRIIKYRNIIIDFLNNTRTLSEVTVLDFDYEITIQYGVDFYRLNVLEWSTIEEDYVKRSILIDKEIKNLSFNNGEILKIATCSNMLVAYSKVEDEKN